MEELTKIEADVHVLAEQFKILAREGIHTVEDYRSAGECLIEIKSARRRIDAALDPSIEAAYQTHKKILAFKRRVTDRIDESERMVKLSMQVYRTAEEKAARARELDLRERLSREREEAALKEAVELTAEGREAEADSILEAVEAAPAPAVIVVPDVPKIDGVSFRKTWKFRVVNPDAVPRDFLRIDEQKLGAYARTMKEMAKVSGVEFWPEDVVSASSGAGEKALP